MKGSAVEELVEDRVHKGRLLTLGKLQGHRVRHADNGLLSRTRTLKFIVVLSLRAWKRREDCGRGRREQG